MEAGTAVFELARLLRVCSCILFACSTDHLCKACLRTLMLLRTSAESLGRSEKNSGIYTCCSENKGEEQKARKQDEGKTQRSVDDQLFNSKPRHQMKKTSTDGQSRE